MPLEDTLAAAAAARRENRPQDALDILTQAVKQDRDPRALTALGQIERDLGNNKSALALYREAAEIWRNRTDAPRLAHTIRHAADILLDLGRLPEAEPLYAEALALYRADSAARPMDIANTLRGYAILKQQTNQSEPARAYWQEAREIYAAHGIAQGVKEADRRLAHL